MAYRTDLAVELLENLRGRDELSGVSEREYEREGLHIHEAEVTTERAARLLGKPCGRYLTLSLEALSRREEEAFPRSVRVLAALIETLLPPLDSAAPVLIAGLGSRSSTPDAVGPRSADHVIATRHLISRSPEFFASWRPVSVLAPGVLGQTGVETGEIVRGVLDHVRPRAVIAIDALAAGRLSRLVRTVQLADTGIVPGSGVNNARTALDRQTLGVPVVSLGVPTVAACGMVRARGGRRAACGGAAGRRGRSAGGALEARPQSRLSLLRHRARIRRARGRGRGLCAARGCCRTGRRRRRAAERERLCALRSRGCRACALRAGQGRDPHHQQRYRL